MHLALGLSPWTLGMPVDQGLFRNQISQISSILRRTKKRFLLLGWDSPPPNTVLPVDIISDTILPLMLTLAFSLADTRMVRWAMPTLILRTPRYRRKSCV